jgi:hypothetical protein
MTEASDDLLNKLFVQTSYNEGVMLTQAAALEILINKLGQTELSP